MSNRKKVYTVDGRNVDKKANSKEGVAFAKTLNKLLEEKQISTTQIIKDLPISQGSISGYRNGTKQPTLGNIILLANYLGVDCNYLMTGVSCENSSINREIGLSELAIARIQKLKETDRMEWGLSVFNKFIESDKFEELLCYLTDYCTKKNDSIWEGYYKIYTRDIAEAKVNSVLQEIKKELGEYFSNKLDTDDRLYYSFLHSIYNEGRITKEQYEKTVREYDKGNYDYNPFSKDNK